MELILKSWNSKIAECYSVEPWRIGWSFYTTVAEDIFPRARSHIVSAASRPSGIGCTSKWLHYQNECN